MKLKSLAFAVLFLMTCSAGALAQGAGGGDARTRGYAYAYGLTPDEIAPGVHVFWGRQEPMTMENGANVVNTGFIVGADSVLAMDTGPTRIYGEEMLAVIGETTDKPVRMAVVTHHHFDHAFGISVFKKANIPTLMHFAARPLLMRDGESVLQFMEILVGLNWVTRIETFDLGDRPIKVIPYEAGHTPGDLVVYDEKTKTRFAGDLVFVGRTPTIPHAHIPTWLAHLDALTALEWERLVPGHGPLVTDPAELAVMRDYLVFLRDFVRDAANRGETLADSLEAEVPERFRSLAEIEIEFQRALLKLFRDEERTALDMTVH